jgi:ATP-dependent 26S proteasome regulatory subunit
MMPLLMENKDIVLVIEDAEKALVSRDESGRSDLVSTILNLTDGFLGHALNITVVATFNTAKEKIDEALLRKGRLKHCYEFGKLSKEQARKLADSLNLPRTSITESMTLADIYNLEAETGYVKEEEKRVGFF